MWPLGDTKACNLLLNGAYDRKDEIAEPYLPQDATSRRIKRGCGGVHNVYNLRIDGEAESTTEAVPQLIRFGRFRGPVNTHV